MQTATPLVVGTSVVYPVPTGDLSEVDQLDVPEITAPQDDAAIQGTEVVVEGSTVANARVIVYDNDAPLGMVVVDGEGQWRLTPREPLSDGDHTIVARTTDGKRLSRPSDPVRVVVTKERLPVTGGQVWGTVGWVPILLILFLLCAGAAESVLSSARKRDR